MKKIFINTTYIIVVFIVAFTIATTALVRKISTYKSIQQPLFITVDKQEMILTNIVSGRIDEILVEEGDYIKEGELLAKMTDDSVLARISALEAEGIVNASARTEARVLKTKQADYEIRAPREGIVYKVHLAEGSYAGSIMPVVTLYSEGDTNLYMTVSEEQYDELKQEKKILAFSSRLEQTFELILAGVSKASFDEQHNTRNYELRLSFKNTDDEKAFIEGETLELSLHKDENAPKKPAEIVAMVVNAMVGAK